MPDQPTIVAAIITGEQGVLMVCRRKQEGDLLWQFPAGGTEAGETPEQTAVRETLEETGIDVAADHVIGDRVHPATGRHMVYVACTPTNGTAAYVADEDELCEVGWYRYDQLGELLPHGMFEPVDIYLKETIGA